MALSITFQVDDASYFATAFRESPELRPFLLLDWRSAAIRRSLHALAIPAAAATVVAIVVVAFPVSVAVLIVLR